MKLTSLGHACWLIETAGGTVITDPVLFDPFEQGTVTACPSRTFELEKLPKIDLVYISHRHLDHFHGPTLRLLANNIPVLAPNDQLTLAALREFGFTDIRTMQAFTRHSWHNDALQIIPIPSVSEEFLEYGALFVETQSNGQKRCVFNQVDTPLTDEVMQRIKEIVPQIDVHLAMFASQDFGWFQGKPEQIADTYTQNLHTATNLAGRYIIPAASGFRFVDDFDYLNRLLFPIPRDRFISDIKRLLPQSQSSAINPGDCLMVGDEVIVHEQAATYVRMKEDDSHKLRYDPTAAVPELVDHNHQGYPLAHLHGFVQAVLEQGMPAFLQAALQLKQETATIYQEHEATYRIEVIFPDSSQAWSYVFAKDGGFQLIKGDEAPLPATLWRITSSALLDLCEGKKGCWAVRPESRKWSRLLVAERTPKGIRAMELTLPDLLNHFILNMRIRMRGEEQAMLEYYGLLG